MDNKIQESEHLADIFFGGGISQVKELLSEAIRKEREKKGLSNAEFDKLCFFEEDGLPKSKQFESDPKYMNYRIFNRAGCLLGLSLDNVLKLKFDDEKISKVLATMNSTSGGLAAAYDTKANIDIKGIETSKVAPVYAAFKILEEIGAGKN